MRKLFQVLDQKMQHCAAAVLVTVIASSGSVPRGAGAHMLVTRQGRIAGTIGGGAVEYRCEQRAQGVLASGHSQIETFLLHPNRATAFTFRKLPYAVRWDLKRPYSAFS